MRLVIDRIEGGLAFCETDDRSFVEIPLALLPHDAKEGSVLRAHDGVYELDLADEERTKERIHQKMDALFTDDD